LFIQPKALSDVVSLALAIKGAAFPVVSPEMKIATFNINNIRRRLPNLLDWMRETRPDVVCLQ
jgi:hypothetical protein